MNHVWSGWSRRCTMRADLVGAGGVDQRRQLVEAGLGGLVVGAGEGHADEDDALADRPLDEGGAERFVVRGAHGISMVAT